MNAATYMCTYSCGSAAVNIASTGDTSVTSPAASSKPSGLFIHALTAMMKNVPVAPAIATGTSISEWTRPGRRSHPYR